MTKFILDFLAAVVVGFSVGTLIGYLFDKYL